jgi:hypothetical protein
MATPPDGVPMLGAAGLLTESRPRTPDELAQATRARRKVSLRLGLVVIALLLLLETAYLSPFSDPTAIQPLRLPAPIPLAEVQPYGVNTFLHKEVERWKKEKTLDMAANMGAGWIKQQFPWAEIEYRTDPQRPYWDVKNNQNAWDKFDDIVNLAEQYHLRIIARIDNAPGWARPKDSDPKAPPSAEHMQDFGKFIETFVQRYQGRVAAIQVWNEPNLKAEWATGRPVNPAEYVQLLKTAYTSAKQADPNIIVLAAPLAINNELLGYAGNLNEVDYLQGMYDAGAKPYFDAMSANAYGKDAPPEDPPSRQALNFRRVELLHDVTIKNGDQAKAVWFNEYGWNASPPDMPAADLKWGRVTPEQQADYTVRGIEYAQQHWPWAGVFTIWYLRQVGDTPRTNSEYYFGLVDPDFVPSLAYKSVQQAAQRDEKVATPGEWGPLSPPVQAGPDWHVNLDPSAPGGLYISPSAPGNSINLTFMGTDVALTLVPLTNTSTIAARYYVTVDGQTSQIASEVPRDETGQPYIQMPADGKGGVVSVVRGLGAEFRTASHTLQIRVEDVSPSQRGDQTSGGGAVYSPLAQRIDLPGIGLVKIEAHRSYVLFILLTLLLVAGIAFIVLALRRTAPPEASSEMPSDSR